MRLISTVRADAPTSDTKTAKPVPQDTPESTTPDTDDIPDQEVANQTKFIKSIQQYGATESLVVFGLSAGYLSSRSQLALCPLYTTDAAQAQIRVASGRSRSRTDKQRNNNNN